ncbi:type II secretion system protein GspG, partial [Candidatus Saccharibacteria bacterium HGW-Saccharibacteria-1]
MQLNVNLKNKNFQSAFTIVELLVVIVIIGILATIVIIFY